MTTHKTRPGACTRLAARDLLHSTQFQAPDRVRKNRSAGMKQRRSQRNNSLSRLAGKKNKVPKGSTAEEHEAHINRRHPPQQEPGDNLLIAETETSQGTGEEDKSIFRAASVSYTTKHETRRNSSQLPQQQGEQREAPECSSKNDDSDQTVLDQPAYMAAYERLQEERKRKRKRERERKRKLNLAYLSDEVDIAERASSELDLFQVNSSA